MLEDAPRTERATESMDVDAFIRQCWSDHASDAGAVADRLASSFAVIETPDHLARFAGLLTHVYGEHLGEWNAGVVELEKLDKSWGTISGSPAGRPIQVGIATLRYCAGEGTAVNGLSIEDRAAALANASSALAGRNDATRAIEAYDQALRAVQSETCVDARALKALAAGGNNLAVALEGLENRSASETQAMLRAAEAALRYWKQAGTWVEEQIACYRLARSQLQAGQSAAAVRSAERCLQICETHVAPALDQFFAHAVVAFAQRAACNMTSFEAHKSAALSYLQTLSDDDKASCESDRSELDGFSGA